MAEINYNSVFDGVGLALHKAYPEAHVHGGNVKQGLSDGDFNVIPLKPSHSGAMGSRAQREMTFDIVYYPTKRGGRAECLGVAHRLASILDTVTTPEGDKVHGTGINITLNDDALHFIIRYPHFVYVPTETDKLEELTIKQEV